MLCKESLYNFSLTSYQENELKAMDNRHILPRVKSQVSTAIAQGNVHEQNSLGADTGFRKGGGGVRVTVKY